MDKAAFPVQPKYLNGPQNAAENLATEQGYSNPGPTEALRGVEANTARSKGFPVDVPPPSAEDHSA